MSDFLYVVATRARSGGATGPIKVGVTSNLRARLRTLQTGSPRQIAYFAIWDFRDCGSAAESLEGAFHALQGEHRLQGEWYGMAPARGVRILDLYFEQSLVLSGACTREEFRALGITKRHFPDFDPLGRPCASAA